MQDVEPSSALKPLPIPHLLHCMNKYLLKLLVRLFLLRSSPLLDEQTVQLPQMERYERTSQKSCLLVFFVTFSLFLFSIFFLFLQLARSLSASRVNTSCALALLHRIKSTHLELALPPQMSALRLK